jgi:hypothetical protein
MYIYPGAEIKGLLDLSNCANLKTLYIRGKLDGLTFPKNREILEELHTFRSAKITGLPNLLERSSMRIPVSDTRNSILVPPQYDDVI